MATFIGQRVVYRTARAERAGVITGERYDDFGGRWHYRVRFDTPTEFDHLELWLSYGRLELADAPAPEPAN